MGRFFSDKVRKCVVYFGLFESFLHFFEIRRRNKYCLWVAKCKFIVKNSSFKMLVVFSPIFVADTKITFVYNFVAPLRKDIKVKLSQSDIFTIFLYQGTFSKFSDNFYCKYLSQKFNTPLLSYSPKFFWPFLLVHFFT